MSARPLRARARPSDLLAPRRDRRRSAIAAAGLFAVLLVLAAGAALGRATAPRAEAPAEPVEASGPGPSRTVSGVPVGYARTESGAVAAAANYTVVLGGKENIDPAFGEQAYAAFALPSAQEDLLRESREFAATVEDAGALAGDPSVVLRAAPLGYRVDSYTDDEATISVWYVAVAIGTTELPMTTSWGTDRVTLQWSEGDWKASGFAGEAGPEPPDGVTVAHDADLAARMNGFEPFTYQPVAEL